MKLMARISANSKYFNTGIHILVWLVLLIIPATLFGTQEEFQGLTHSFFIWSNLYHVGLFYFNAFYLYPRLLTRKWWWLYILCLPALAFLSYFLKLLLLKTDPSFQLTEINQRIIFFGPVPFLIASIIFRLISDRIRFERAEKEARAEKLAAELKFLRSQISPHFIFNVMTNLVSLARQRSDLLEPSLIRLSDLLRYMLYETGKDKFSVEAEVDYLKSYIALQQLRFGDEVQIELDMDTEDRHCILEPMLLIPFVENAFKHGIGLVQDPYIKVFLRVKNAHLFFRVENNYNKQLVSKDKSSGIGLENIRKRLNLLYAGKYSLHMEDNGEIYHVELNLELAC